MNELTMAKGMIPEIKKQVQRAEIRWKRSLHEADWDYFLKKTKELERLTSLLRDEEENNKVTSHHAA